MNGANAVLKRVVASNVRWVVDSSWMFILSMLCSGWCSTSSLFMLVVYTVVHVRLSVNKRTKEIIVSNNRCADFVLKIDHPSITNM